MHQSFTEPITPITEQSIDVIDELASTLKAWLDEAQKKYRQLRMKNVSKAKYELMCKHGEQLAVIHFDEWQKFYKNNVGERCDYDKLQKLFYKFCKIKLKEKERKGWSLW